MFKKKSLQKIFFKDINKILFQEKKERKSDNHKKYELVAHKYLDKVFINNIRLRNYELFKILFFKDFVELECFNLISLAVISCFD